MVERPMRQQRVTGTPDNTAAGVPTSAWSPFRSTAFTVLWLATVVSNVDVWMQKRCCRLAHDGTNVRSIPGFACSDCDIRSHVFVCTSGGSSC